MFAKKWVAFASLMVAASLPAFANSSASDLDSQVLFASSSEIAVTSTGSANFEDRLLFRSTLQDVTSGSNGILMANWMNSQPVEIKNQERTATLPEPGSGVLFCIGLLALLYRVGARFNAHEY